MTRWKLAMRFGEPAEKVFMLLPALLKLATIILGRGGSKNNTGGAKKSNASSCPIYGSLVDMPYSEA